LQFALDARHHVNHTHTREIMKAYLLNNNKKNAIYIAQIRAQQQMGCRVISVQRERLSA